MRLPASPATAPPHQTLLDILALRKTLGDVQVGPPWGCTLHAVLQAVRSAVRISRPRPQALDH